MANKIFDQSKRQLITLAVASSVSWLAHLCLPITHAHAAENSKKLKNVKKASSVKNTQTIKKGQSLTPNPKLGINISDVNYFSTEYPFVDLMKMSSGFNLDNSNDASDKDSNGYFKKIPKGAKYATCLVCEGIENARIDQYIKSGRYVFLYDGAAAVLQDYNKKMRDKNIIEFKEVKVVSVKPNRIELDCDFLNGMRINLFSLHPTKPITNMRIIPIEQENTYLNDPWKPEFLALWSGVQCMRFMDMMHTNGSQQSSWQNRPLPTYLTYSMNEFLPDGKGMPLEMMVDLANRLNVDPWFCIPHLADDDYVSQFLSYLKNKLNPSLKAYIEYSNEIWNYGFIQTDYATKQAIKLNLPRADGDKGAGGASEYKAYRSKQIFKMADGIFGAERATRIVRVLASQAAYTAMSEAVCMFQNAYQQADVLAIAPYPQFMVSPNGDLQENFVRHWTVAQVIAHLHTKALPETIGWINESKKVADKFGLKLVAYEGGQHCVGVAGSENNDAITKLLKEVNADAGMGELYTKLLNAWQQAGGDLFCHFNSVGKWSKWGCWSALQSLYQPLGSSPKYQAIAKWANSVGQKMPL